MVAGDHAEIETGGLGGERFVGFQIYFVSNAPMEYQGVGLGFQLNTQAIQYRNNPYPEWANVVDEEFVLGELNRYVVIPDTPVWNHTTSAYWRLYNDGLVIVGPGTIHWPTASTTGPWHAHRDDIERIVFTGAITSGPANNQRTIAWLFAGLPNLTHVNGLEHFDTSNMTVMYSMFRGTSNLTSVVIPPNWDTSSVTNTGRMFQDSGVTSVDLSHLDTSSLQRTQSMFEGASNITHLNLSNFNMSNVITTHSMFNNMTSLTSLNITGWDTSNVETMHSMFANTSSMTSLDVSSLNTSNVTSTYRMFGGMSSLTTIDVSGFDTSNVTNMGGMFEEMTNLTQIIGLNNFDTSSLVSIQRMFRHSSSLYHIDLSSFNTDRTMSTMATMFQGVSSLRQLSFGANTRFNAQNHNLPNVPNNALYTGLWVSLGSGETLTSVQLIERYRTNPTADTWVWQTR